MNDSFRNYLNTWYATPSGAVFAKQMDDLLTPWLQGVFGYHGVQLGNFVPETPLIRHARTNHTVIADCERDGGVCCTAEAMPFATDALDLLILPHTLELSEDPRAVLREVDRVLVPDGRLLIIGMDPWTLWNGLQRLKGRRYPFHTQGRIKDWLDLLGLEQERSALLPVSRWNLPEWLARWPKTRQLGNLMASNVAGGYAIMAQKRTTTMTTVRMRWRLKPRLVAGGFTRPAVRNGNHG
ncbi:MAG: class I SAM-dependent methyltransferase [Thiotrichales bacterium]